MPTAVANLLFWRYWRGSLKADGGSLKIDGTDAFADAKVFQKYIGFVPRGESTYGEAVGKR